MIKFEQVGKIYTGQAGCCDCGCSGKYEIASHLGVDAANVQVGYTEFYKTNDRAVKLAVNKINKLIDWNNPEDVNTYVDFDDDGTAIYAWHYHGKDNNRVVAVCFVKGTHLAIPQRAPKSD